MHRFYWAINLGALISYTAIAYICQYGMGPVFGGVTWGFVVGYSIPCITMGTNTTVFAFVRSSNHIIVHVVCVRAGLAILVFYVGSYGYKIATPSGSILATAVNVKLHISN